MARLKFPSTSGTAHDPRRSRLGAAVAACAVLLMLARPAASKDPVPIKPVPTIYVRFRLDLKTEDMKRVLNNGDVEWKEAAVSTMIAMVDATRSARDGRFPWPFKPWDSLSASPESPLIILDVVVSERVHGPAESVRRTSWVLSLSCNSQVLSGSKSISSPPLLSLSPRFEGSLDPELVRNPRNVPLPPAFKTIVGTFQSFALDLDKPVLNELLMEVAPIGQGTLLIDPGEPLAQDPNAPPGEVKIARGLLYLSWADYRLYSGSDFEVYCTSKSKGISTWFVSQGARRAYPLGAPVKGLLINLKQMVVEDGRRVDIDLTIPAHRKRLEYFAGPQFESWFFLRQFVPEGPPIPRPGPVSAPSH